MTDYRQKYLDSFFKWQEAYGKAMQRIEELEKENKELKEKLNGKKIRFNLSGQNFLHDQFKD